MKITNQFGAPEQFVRALKNDSYSKGEADFSATGLLRPPQIAHLEKLHEEKLSTDVIWTSAAIKVSKVGFTN